MKKSSNGGDWMYNRCWPGWQNLNPGKEAPKRERGGTSITLLLWPSPGISSFKKGALKLLVAILLGIAAWGWVRCQTSYLQASLSQQTPLFAAANLDKAIEGMKETNNLLINWAIILLGGTLTIAILAKGIK